MAPVELALQRDTCNVFVLKTGRDAVCVDFGSGAVLDHLDELGVDRITDVLVTHYHRDGVQGLPRAVEAGARVWVPPVERDLFTDARGHWERLRPSVSYEVRQETLAPVADIEVAGTVDEYRARSYGGVDAYALPTPGHTMGSVSYLVEIDGRLHAFCGDLVHAGGRVWSLAATQWTYVGVGGQAATLLSLGALAARKPAVVHPAHGESIDGPEVAFGQAEARLAELLELRRAEDAPFGYRRWLEHPWEHVLPHLLVNTTSEACSYALLSDGGSALLVDWGYDWWAGWPLGGERHHCRPLLGSIESLRRDHGVTRIDAVLTTHYHDDHVAGINLLREVEGVEVWSPENVAPILEHPERYDLPCLWFDPVPVDRILRFDEALRWQEYEIRTHPLPGHTRYASAFEVEVDGRRVLATGDQQSHEANGRMVPNYQYRNRFAIDDYVATVELYDRLRPEIMLTGHGRAQEPTAAAFARLRDDAQRIADLHRELLPVPDAEGVLARIVPYRATASAGAALELVVEVRNPFAEELPARVALVVPDGWGCEPAEQTTAVAAAGEAVVRFRLTVGRERGDEPVLADVTVGELALGLHADARVTVR
jgi:glyoxylase-like metal-dependent hydrolase (beta-lactamase superfamily II)